MRPPPVRADGWPGARSFGFLNPWELLPTSMRIGINDLAMARSDWRACHVGDSQIRRWRRLAGAGAVMA
jgi:hypothetical protein